MRSNTNYPVTVIKQIPYVTKLLGGIVSVCLVICLIAWFLYFPSTDSGNEMKTVTMFSGTPAKALWIFVYCFAGIIPAYFLYVKLRIRKPALLFFNVDNIMLQDKKLLKAIPVSNIRNVQFSEPNLHSTVLSQKLIIKIELYDAEAIRFRVREYEHVDEILESFFSYPELKDRLKETVNTFLESDIDK